MCVSVCVCVYVCVCVRVCVCVWKCMQILHAEAETIMFYLFIYYYFKNFFHIVLQFTKPVFDILAYKYMNFTMF